MRFHTGNLPRQRPEGVLDPQDDAAATFTCILVRVANAPGSSLPSARTPCKETSNTLQGSLQYRCNTPAKTPAKTMPITYKAPWKCVAELICRLPDLICRHNKNVTYFQENDTGVRENHQKNYIHGDGLVACAEPSTAHLGDGVILQEVSCPYFVLGAKFGSSHNYLKPAFSIMIQFE